MMWHKIFTPKLWIVKTDNISAHSSNFYFHFLTSCLKSQRPNPNRCWKTQLSILTNKKVDSYPIFLQRVKKGMTSVMVDVEQPMRNSTSLEFLHSVILTKRVNFINVNVASQVTRIRNRYNDLDQAKKDNWNCQKHQNLSNY